MTLPDSSLHLLTVQEAAGLIGEGRIDASTYAEALLHRLSETRGLGGVISVQPDEVRRSAKAAGASGALRGVALIVKDNIDVEGMPTTAGSPALGGLIAQRDAPVVDRLLAAGALVLGKANMHEFALGITNNNAFFGPARNPADPARIAGGSSGGTATVVASFAAPAGIGTDTGGSVRIPAALCGIVGFRPTVGRWPGGGTVPISHTMDTAGPMARSVADCALVDAVVIGDASPLEAVDLSAFRIGVPRPHFWDDLDPEMRAAGEAVLGLLRKQGAVLVECEVRGVAQLSAGSTAVALFEMLPGIQGYLADQGRPMSVAQIVQATGSPDVREALEGLLGEGAIPRQAYEHALHELRPALQQAYADCFSAHRLDALIFPTTPMAAPAIGTDRSVALNGRPVPVFPTFIRNTSPSAFAGMPGISLPMGRTSTGLPQGIELDGPAGRDRHLLTLALAVERALAHGLPK